MLQIENSLANYTFPIYNSTGIIRDPIVIDGAPLKEFSLPDEYSNVPAMSCKTDKLCVSQLAFEDKPVSSLEIAKVEEDKVEEDKVEEDKWVQHNIHLLSRNTFAEDEYLSRAAFHASLDIIEYSSFPSNNCTSTFIWGMVYCIRSLQLYVRWIPIHLRDMKALSAQAKEQLAFMGYTKITEKIFLHALLIKPMSGTMNL